MSKQFSHWSHCSLSTQSFTRFGSETLVSLITLQVINKQIRLARQKVYLERYSLPHMCYNSLLLKAKSFKFYQSFKAGLLVQFEAADIFTKLICLYHIELARQHADNYRFPFWSLSKVSIWITQSRLANVLRSTSVSK